MVPKVKTIGVAKARIEFENLLKRVARGGEIVISKRGRPVARLLPPLNPKKWNKNVFDRLRALRGSLVLAKGETVKDLINAGRRI